MTPHKATRIYVDQLHQQWVVMGQPENHALLMDSSHILSLMVETGVSTAQLEERFGGLQIVRAHIQHPRLIKLY